MSFKAKLKRTIYRAAMLSAMMALAIWGLLALASPLMLIIIIILLRTPCR